MEFESLITTRTIITDIPLEFQIGDVFKKTPLRQTLKGYDSQVIACYYQNQYKGDEFEKKKTGSFRNAVNIIILNNQKKLNLKLSTNGNFQITGCKNLQMVQSSLQYLLHLLHEFCPEAIRGWRNNLKVEVRMVMTNIVFDIGFQIDKIKMNKLVEGKNFYSLFETNFGYTGMNIKIPLPDEAYIVSNPFMRLQNNQWIVDFQKMRVHTKKKKYNTFLVFHSGKIIMSGMCEENMKNDYVFFKNFLIQNRKLIEEVIEV
jgi:TATA-box binding protein (TBP) (component of TFIID and TFIIIB)